MPNPESGTVARLSDPHLLSSETSKQCDNNKIKCVCPGVPKAGIRAGEKSVRRRARTSAPDCRDDGDCWPKMTVRPCVAAAAAAAAATGTHVSSSVMQCRSQRDTRLEPRLFIYAISGRCITDTL